MIQCIPHRKIYYNDENGYTIAAYKTYQTIPESAENQSFKSGESVFTAIGTAIPFIEGIDTGLEGKWIKTSYGLQLSVTESQIFMPTTKEGITCYLASGLIKGIGPVTAGRIVKRFGEDTLKIFDTQPEKLLEVKGITKSKLETILSSYSESRSLRELMQYLAPLKVGPKRVSEICDYFGSKALQIVKEKPFRLFELSGFGFESADIIARRNKNFRPDDTLRIKAAILQVLKNSEGDGHLYLEGRDIVRQAAELLNYGIYRQAVNTRLIKDIGNEMVFSDELLAAEGHYLYSMKNYMAEKMAAVHILRVMNNKQPVYDIERELDEVQGTTHMVLAKQQKEAVRRVFANSLSIITGGPGTGKTTVERIILKVFEKKERKKTALLCAPTGRASRNMVISTGYPAMTIHKALYITGEEEEVNLDLTEELEEDLIIVDEMSMVDMWLFFVLISKVKNGARVVFIGDPDQIPSVGPGNVFKEMIDSGVIPVTVLDVQFRQAEGSRIIINALKMNNGDTDLLFGDDFQFISVDSDEVAAEVIADLYQKKLEANHGDTDMVQVLTPFRQDTAVGANALNKKLRELVNPQVQGCLEMKLGSSVFRLQDKVMQLKNKEEVSNGDMGIVTDIYQNDDGTPTLVVRFEDGRIGEYASEDYGLLMLAYAATIHKSQGSAYPSVIIPVLPCFKRMLKRNIYYTAVTRARCEVTLVGDWAAFCEAVMTDDREKRNTKLAYRIQQEALRIEKIKSQETGADKRIAS
ncbi:ATP-dependent RecD-like DNA helicase [Hungatella sp. L12]|uniref:ATP-dependent RecD2 DNA helicase n=1 Tax=Hungatella hominis TaxID=2763050 RepID=A0ABR7HFS0_9FIRM|nr:ATP-dependent RecD-like DNA helicase [Hungatella hominis]MBC5712051.1 ATP-dependent RecD-like DNA helicase [Hungatella hominis]